MWAWEAAWGRRGEGSGASVGAGVAGVQSDNVARVGVQEEEEAELWWRGMSVGGSACGDGEAGGVEDTPGSWPATPAFSSSFSSSSATIIPLNPLPPIYRDPFPTLHTF